jgi:ABC-2 type transport system permease protein
VLIVVGVMVATSVAVVVAAVARSAEQATSFGAAVALVLGLLGGTFFPVSQTDGFLSTASFLSPHRWLLEAFRDVSFGAGVSDLGLTLAVLLAFTAVVGGIGLVSTQRRLVQP